MRPKTPIEAVLGDFLRDLGPEAVSDVHQAILNWVFENPECGWGLARKLRAEHVVLPWRYYRECSAWQCQTLGGDVAVTLTCVSPGCYSWSSSLSIVQEYLPPLSSSDASSSESWRRRIFGHAHRRVAETVYSATSLEEAHQQVCEALETGGWRFLHRGPPVPPETPAIGTWTSSNPPRTP